MTLYKQDALDLAALEDQVAANIKAQFGGGLVEQNSVLYHAMRTCSLRALALTTIAATLDNAPATSTPTPSPTPSPSPTPTPTPSQTKMPAPSTSTAWTATGRVCKINCDQDSPGNPVPSWNEWFHNQQTSSTVLRDGDQNKALPWVIQPRTGNLSDANGYGQLPDPTSSGNAPYQVIQSNHTNLAGYPINDAIAGFEPSYAFDFEFYGSRQQDGSYTQFDVGDPGNVVASQFLDVGRNTNRKLVFPKLRCAPNGQIYWSWYDVAVNGVQSGHACMAAVLIREYAPA
ncbi:MULTISPECIES: hypothetical protein [unclassified Sphingomonas]|uniref:hypothetical protein n=1 Tax=unclassified Sphingomonas TaxID=196159 RepID=UPI0022698E86|nr:MULTISPECIES: hypothetical protein [unclassified Sphingomonas]